MENNKKEAMKKRIETIEGFFGKSGQELDIFGELSTIKMKYKVRYELGLMKYLSAEDTVDLQKVVAICEEYIKGSKADAEWLIQKGVWGLPLEVEDKVELAKYHTALQYAWLFGR
jgi:hypothetical protein